MAALINMAMLYRPLPFVEGKKQQKQHLDHFPVFPIKSATPSESPFLPNIRRRLVSQRTPKEPFGSFFPLRLGSGGRRPAPARAGASDCAGFAPNKTQPRLSLTALSLAPCHLHKPPFSSFHRSVCLCPLALK